MELPDISGIEWKRSRGWKNGRRERKSQTRVPERNRQAKYKLERGCDICRYRRNSSALHFHHMDRRTKTGPVVNPFTQPEELAKCRLLCANCHAEITNPRLQAENVWREK